MMIFLLNIIALETQKFFGNNEPRKSEKSKWTLGQKVVDFSIDQLFHWSKVKSAKFKPKRLSKKDKKIVLVLG